MSGTGRFLKYTDMPSVFFDAFLADSRQGTQAKADTESMEKTEFAGHGFQEQTCPDCGVSLKSDRVCPNLCDDPLCWRCGQPDSGHSYFQGVTYCLPDADEDPDEAIYNREIQLYPPELSDEELVRRFQFLRDTQEWMR